MNTYERLSKIIEDYFNPEAITPQSSFIDDLGLDSLDMVELVMAVEDEFGIEVDDEEAKHLLIVADVVKYIDRHIS